MGVWGLTLFKGLIDLRLIFIFYIKKSGRSILEGDALGNFKWRFNLAFIQLFRRYYNYAFEFYVF